MLVFVVAFAASPTLHVVISDLGFCMQHGSASVYSSTLARANLLAGWLADWMVGWLDGRMLGIMLHERGSMSLSLPLWAVCDNPSTFAWCRCSCHSCCCPCLVAAATAAAVGQHYALPHLRLNLINAHICQQNANYSLQRSLMMTLFAGVANPALYAHATLLLLLLLLFFCSCLFAYSLHYS